MTTLLGLTDESQQVSTITLPDGTPVTLTLEFSSQQFGWFFDLDIAGTPYAYGRRLVSSPNIMRQYIRLLDWGLAVICAGQVDPTTLDTFVDGTTTLYLLDAADVAAVEAAIFTRA